MVTRSKPKWKRLLLDIGAEAGVNQELERLMQEPPNGWGGGGRRRNGIFVPFDGRLKLHLIPAKPIPRKKLALGDKLRNLQTDIDVEALAGAPPEVQLRVLLRAVESLRIHALEAVQVWLAVGGDHESVDALIGAKRDEEPAELAGAGL